MVVDGSREASANETESKTPNPNPSSPQYPLRNRLRPIPPPPSSSSVNIPDLQICHVCHGHKPGGGDLVVLVSRWRVLLLCVGCDARIGSGAICSYCFSEAGDHILSCQRCLRSIHWHCIPNHRYYLSPLQIEGQETFACIDCYPIPRPRRQSAASNDDVDAVSEALEPLSLFHFDGQID